MTHRATSIWFRKRFCLTISGIKVIAISRNFFKLENNIFLGGNSIDFTIFLDLPMNNRPSVYPHILQPMVLKGERNSLLQAEVHFRLTPDTNRITILVNNMRLMGIFDWWLLVLDFISLPPEGAPPQNDRFVGFFYIFGVYFFQKKVMS